MVRNSPQVVRLFFGLVIAAAFFGWWYASTFWQIDPTTLFTSTSPNGEGDWVDLFASVADRLLQTFLNLASADN